VATDTATHYSGLRPDRVRSLDHLEAGVCATPERLPGRHRVRVHVPSCEVRSTYDIVRSWAIVGVSSGSFGAFLALLQARGLW